MPRPSTRSAGSPKRSRRSAPRLEDVVRTRLYFTDLSTAADGVRAHGEIFKGIRPVTTGVEVGLTVPGMMVEVEVDAIVADLL